MLLLDAARKAPTNHLWNKLIWDCNKNPSPFHSWSYTPLKIFNACALPFQFLATCALALLDHTFGNLLRLAQLISSKKPKTKKSAFRTASTLQQNNTIITSRDLFNSESLHLPATQGNARAVQELLTNNPTIINAKNHCGQTALHLAAMKGNVNVIQVLLENNADINAADILGQTPLHLAAIKGNVGAVQALLNNDLIEVNAQDHYEKTPLDLAIDQKKYSLLNKNAFDGVIELLQEKTNQAQ